ncbi:MAG: DHA2 family efflux MFS transporter permease subunit [Candidatus Acidiferrum sp.]
MAQSETLIATDFTRPGVNPWVIAFTVMLATFMEVLDTSIANVALPHIAGSLSAGVDESTWVLTSYLVSNAIVLPLTGWFSKLFGRKSFYMSCVLIFIVSSFLCGVATSLPMLVFFRVLQGAGGGGLQPVSQAILVESFPRAKQGMAMAVYGMGVVVAPVVGPTLGGWLTDNYSWRWIFFINIPVGLLSIFLTSSLIHDPRYLAALHGLSAGLQEKGSSACTAAEQAGAILYGALQRQAAMLAFIDVFWILGVVCLAMIPLMFLIKSPGQHGETVPMH